MKRKKTSEFNIPFLLKTNHRSLVFDTACPHNEVNLSCSDMRYVLIYICFIWSAYMSKCPVYKLISCVKIDKYLMGESYYAFKKM